MPAQTPAEKWADWLVDAIATATQDRRYLRNNPAEDKVATEAIYLNGKKAIENALKDSTDLKARPMAMTPPLYSEEASKLMLDGLTDGIRSRLREIIIERIEPDIQTAIEAGLASFKASIESYLDPSEMRNTIRVLIERKDQK